MRARLFLLVILPALFSSSPAAAAPSLVRDFYPGTESFSALTGIGAAVESGGILYFPAKDPAHGMELWRTDGTTAGTYRVTDICPGPCDSVPGEITPFKGEVYFSANDGVSGRELWASRGMPGTPGSARRVRDLCPGPCNSHPSSLQELNGRLLFEASVGTSRGLWSTNGSRRGTVLLRGLCTAGDDNDFFSSCSFEGIHRVGSVVLFLMNDSRLGIWRSDGTPEGTGPTGFPVDVTTIVPVDGNSAFLLATDGLWWTDGTSPGTRRLRTWAELGVPDRSLPFSARSTIWHGMLISVIPTGQAPALLRSDGTAEGTVLLGQLPAGSNPIGFAPLQDALLVLLQSPEVLWRTAGTPETTGQAVTLPGFVYGIAPVQGNTAVFCVAQSELAGTLWVTDGTQGGTRLLEGAPPTLGCSVGPIPLVGGRLLFLASSWEVWGTDGAPAGTSLVYDFGEVPASSGPLSQIGLNGRLLFSARISESEAPLFVSDGTAAGTRRISEEAGWVIEGFTRVGGRVFFEPMEPAVPPERLPFKSLGLWSSDGTEAGTRAVKRSIREHGSPTAVGNALFFSAAREFGFGGEPDLELFRTDGSAEHTGLVKNINRFELESIHHICYSAPSNPGPGIELNGRLLFTADDGKNGRELWISDGKAAGTRLVRDIDPRRLPEPPPGACDVELQPDTGIGSDPAGFVRFGNAVLFAASDGQAGRELWRTDGTPAGTQRVKDLRPGAQGSNPHDLVAFRGKVWLIASAQGLGEGLWRTDGTAAGTRLVHRLALGTFPSWAGGLTVAGGRLFFRVYNETTGAELWASDGDTASTRMVADLRPGPVSSSPQSLTAVARPQNKAVLVFAADDGVHGLEPWQSDGTAAGTVPLGDINPGLDASGAGPFTLVNGARVLTGADDGVHGRELWVIPLE